MLLMLCVRTFTVNNAFNMNGCKLPLKLTVAQMFPCNIAIFPLSPLSGY
jgi:hypothetical protein